MRREGLLAVIAGVLLAVGLLLGYVPVHSSDGQDCGSPFASKVNHLRRTGDLEKGFLGLVGVQVNSTSTSDAATECESKQNGTRPIAILLIALGGAALAGAFISFVVSETRKESPSTNAAGGGLEGSPSESGATRVDTATADGADQALSAPLEVAESDSGGEEKLSGGGLAIVAIGLVMVVVIILAAVTPKA